MPIPFREELTLLVQDLLKRLSYDGEVKVLERQTKTGALEWHCDVFVREGQSLLIGQHGGNIASLSHLIRVLARKKMPEHALITLDINHYFAEKQAFLERNALEVAKEVEETGLSRPLQPMHSFERKFIHTLFAEHPTVTTESVGLGEERKVLLKKRPIHSDEEGGVSPLS